MRQEFSNKKPSFSSVKNITEKEEEKGNLRDRETIVEELATVIVLAAVHRPTICRRLPLLLIILVNVLVFYCFVLVKELGLDLLN